MASRAIFIALALFWMTMTGLLWRQEFWTKATGTAVPLILVWEKILTSPDDSPLTVYRHGRNIGFCKWDTSVGGGLSRLTDELSPAEMAERPQDYRLRVTSHMVLSEMTNRIRFTGEFLFSQPEKWQELNVSFGFRPLELEIHAVAAAQTIRVKATDELTRFEHLFRFSDFQDPEALLAEMFGPISGVFLTELTAGFKPSNLTVSVLWEARNDTLIIGHTPVPVYRLRARMLDRYEAVVMVSRVGEILRVDLPNGITMRNDRLGLL